MSQVLGGRIWPRQPRRGSADASRTRGCLLSWVHHGTRPGPAQGAAVAVCPRESACNLGNPSGFNKYNQYLLHLGCCLLSPFRGTCHFHSSAETSLIVFTKRAGFSGLPNKVPPTGCLATINSYSCTIPEAGSQQSRYLPGVHPRRAPGESLPASSCPVGCWPSWRPWPHTVSPHALRRPRPRVAACPV